MKELMIYRAFLDMATLAGAPMKALELAAAQLTESEAAQLAGIAERVKSAADLARAQRTMDEASEAGRAA